MRAALLLVACSLSPARADEALDGLRDRVAEDLRAGRPLVVEAHVALCDNRVIRCGGHGLGDGDDLERNLYWATSGGMRGWMERRGSPWKRVAILDGDGAILETRVWRKRVSPSEAWRKRGVRAPFDVFVVARAWRGTAIDAALDAYVADLAAPAPREVALPDGKTLAAGGAAQVVAWIGHNRFMDRDPYDWPPLPAAARPKGTIAVACYSRDYLAPALGRARVPLLVTGDFVFAGSHAFDGALAAFLDGGDLAAIRDGGARAYADGEGKSFARVRTAFTNPSDPRWRRAAR